MMRFASTLLGACIAFSLVVSCGSSTHSNDDPHATISGTVGGEVIALTDALGFQGILRGQGGAVTKVGFAAGNRAGLCALVQGREGVSNLKVFTVEVGVAYSTGPDRTIGPGTYSLHDASTPFGTAAATVTTDGTDANCRLVNASVSATSGTVSLTVVTSSEIAGSFDVFFGSEHVTGTFDAPICDGLAFADLAPEGAACK